MSLTKNYMELKSRIKAAVALNEMVGDRDNSLLNTIFPTCGKQTATERYGVTDPLLKIIQTLHAKLPEAEADDFTIAFVDAIGCDGKDLSLIHWKFLHAELLDLPRQPYDVQKAIVSVIEGLELLASGGEWREREARAAAKAVIDNASDLNHADTTYFRTRFAVYAARAAARAAFHAARAAARAARSASYANDAARSATYAAYAADAANVEYPVFRKHQWKRLLRLITEAPVAETRARHPDPKG